MFKNERRWCPFHHVGGWAQRSINHHDQKYCLYQSWRVVVFLEVSTWIKLSMWWLFMNTSQKQTRKETSRPNLGAFLTWNRSKDNKLGSLTCTDQKTETHEQSRTMRSGRFTELLCHPNFPTCSLLFLMMHRSQICVRSNWRLSQLISKDVDGNMM